MKIKLNTIQDVQDFVKIATNKISGEVLAKQQNYSVDAKSIMGLFSLDLLKPIYLYVDGQPATEEELKKFEVE